MSVRQYTVGFGVSRSSSHRLKLCSRHIVIITRYQLVKSGHVLVELVIVLHDSFVMTSVGHVTLKKVISY